MTSKPIQYIVLGVIYLAILFVLVRPQSSAASAVENISAALTSLVKTASGNTTSS